ncbi:MAG: WecB/TagA/CpsF family glycosyltransferase [Patescibacteria group bacterium]
MPAEILGVKINRIDLDGTLRRIDELLTGTNGRLIATVNPEFILAAQKNEAFRQAINQAAIATADGFGLILAGLFLKQGRLSRVTGVDLSLALLKGRCPEAKIYLLGGAEEVAAAVRAKFPHGRIVGAEAGGNLLPNLYELKNNEAVLKRVNDSGANLLLAAFGQIRQEMWLTENLPKMPLIKVGIGVGGTFDYLSGKTKRPPAIIRKAGLEWLYRLVREPKRWQRIWNATVVFGWLVFKEKLK